MAIVRADILDHENKPVNLTWKTSKKAKDAKEKLDEEYGLHGAVCKDDIDLDENGSWNLALPTGLS